MKYGFIIDNRKCIGCHACTVACKSEHEVPIGVNRTWVKYVEKGKYPHTRRVFSVMRCNHCESAPCVTICPVTALYKRSDGIVDFDNDRCIGCKACTQACPYDALYIDPEKNTAAKCNYCAHRVDRGLEPACVNVCPEQAIISGDVENPNSQISQLLAREQVSVRKPEKGTNPQLYYINGDSGSLEPTATKASDAYMTSSQSGGVGHYARFLQTRIEQGPVEKDPLPILPERKGSQSTSEEPAKASEELPTVRRVSDAPDKGIMWDWKVSAYIWTKAIATGVPIMVFVMHALFLRESSPALQWFGFFSAMVFLGLTSLLLVLDLDRPTRFLYVLLRPQWSSWLVKGAYIISAYGLSLCLWAICRLLAYTTLANYLAVLSTALAVASAVYTAFLFAQAKGRDLWQSPLLPIHMLFHSLVAGTGVLMLVVPLFTDLYLHQIGLITIFALVLLGHALVTFCELYTPHATEDMKMAVNIILRGRYRVLFIGGGLLLGVLIPLLCIVAWPVGVVLWLCAVFALCGLFLAIHCWVIAPQLIPLS